MATKHVSSRAERESGQASIITVTMFILLFSVLVVSFTQIMLSSSRQAQNDELSARALAAAQSGVEDAKRVLTWCQTNDYSDDACKRISEGAPTNPTCADHDVLAANSDDLNNFLSAEDEQVLVGQNESYLCLIIDSMPYEYDNDIQENKSLVIPMQWAKEDGTPINVDTVTVTWTRDKASGLVTALTSGDRFPVYSGWNSYPVMRIEVARKKNISQLINDIQSGAVTLRPSSTASTVPMGGYAMATSNNKIIPFMASDSVERVIKPGPICNIAKCEFKFKLSSDFGDNKIGSLGDHKDYLRLQPIYSGASVTVTAEYQDSSGTNQARYNGLEVGYAQVDVTGRASDAFRRLRAVVKRTTDEWFPEYAIDSGAQVCKNMSVYSGNGSDRCQYQ